MCFSTEGLDMVTVMMEDMDTVMMEVMVTVMEEAEAEIVRSCR